MEIFLMVILVVLVCLCVFILYRLSQLKEKASVSTELVSWLQDMGQRIDSTNKMVDQKLSENITLFNNRLDKAAEAMMGVQKSIGEFSEIGRSMKELQDFLRSPKLRGNIGEQVLRELLSQSLPPDCFVLQYSFRSGEKVDAVVKTSQGLISIDSKFPLSGFRQMVEAAEEVLREDLRKEFRRNVRKHIQDIAKKYIRTDEGTVEYALMYLPAEAIYYEVINDPELYDFASANHILPVSPLSFYAYLKAILLSFEGQRIQSQAKTILSLLQSIKSDYAKSEEAFAVLTKHITNAYNQSGQVGKSFASLGQKIESTSMVSIESTEQKVIE